MSLKVSVVIPVHNAAGDADRNIQGLLEQTLPAEEFEVIWVDDGSTDNTGEMLEALAAQHEHFQVIHIPASGWPGRPRNVGMAAARGEYIQLVDHDDHLAPDALRRLYDMAHRNKSDIVLGKVASFRNPPNSVWNESRDQVDIRSFPLWRSMTAHKLLRTEFLREHDLRFDDEPRRLEDAHFMMRAYFAAERISILADYTCYYHTKRVDGRNIASQGIEPVGYYDNLRDIFEIVEQHTEPGRLRNQIIRRFYRAEMLGRLSDHRLCTYDPDYLTTLFDAQHQLASEKVPETIGKTLPPMERVKSELLRSGDLSTLVEVAERTHQLQAKPHLEALSWQDDKLVLTWTLELVHPDGSPVEFVRNGHEFGPGPELVGEVSVGTSTFAMAKIYVAHRKTQEKWALPTEQSLRFDDQGDGVRATLRGVSTLDPDRLATGTWDLHTHFWVLGLDRRARFVSEQSSAVSSLLQPTLVGQPPRRISPYFTMRSSFAVTLAPAGRRPSHGRAKGAPRGRQLAYRLAVRLARALPHRTQRWLAGQANRIRR